MPATTSRAAEGAPRGTSALRLAAITSATLAFFAANSLLCRAALAPERIDAVTFTAVRLASGAVMLAAIVAARRGRPRGGSFASALALLAYAMAFSLAYVRIGASVGALLLFPAVQITMMGWALARGVPPRPRQWAGAGVALAGLALLGAPGVHRPDLLGAALMIVAGIAWGVYSLRGSGPGDPTATTADNFLRAVPLVVPFFLLAGARPLATEPAGLALAMASGAVASGVGYSLWYAALPHLGATRAATLQLAVPLLAAAGGVLLLDEALTARLVASGAAILAGVALAASRR